jgi:hypothetical protein
MSLTPIRRAVGANAKRGVGQRMSLGVASTAPLASDVSIPLTRLGQREEEDDDPYEDTPREEHTEEEEPPEQPDADEEDAKKARKAAKEKARQEEADEDAKAKALAGRRNMAADFVQWSGGFEQAHARWWAGVASFCAFAAVFMILFLTALAGTDAIPFVPDPPSDFFTTFSSVSLLPQILFIILAPLQLSPETIPPKHWMILAIFIYMLACSLFSLLEFVLSWVYVFAAFDGFLVSPSFSTAQAAGSVVAVVGMIGNLLAIIIALVFEGMLVNDWARRQPKTNAVAGVLLGRRFPGLGLGARTTYKRM